MKVLKIMQAHDPDLVAMLAMRTGMTTREVEAGLDELQQYGYLERTWEGPSDDELRQVYRPTFPKKKRKAKR